MKQPFLILLLAALLAPAVLAETNAQIRVQIAWTNAEGKVEAKTATLQGWKATWDGSNWNASIKLARFGTNVSAGTNGSVFAGIVADRVDIDCTDPYKGLRCRDTNGTAWVLAVTTNGIFFGVQDSGSPQYPLTNRVAKIDQQSSKREKAQNDKPPQGQLQKRIERIEKVLGLDYE